MRTIRGFRSVTFDQVKTAYAEQVRALIAGGVDFLLVETIFDSLNAKAALVAIREVFDEDKVGVAGDDFGGGGTRRGDDDFGADDRGVLECGGACEAAVGGTELFAGAGFDVSVFVGACQRRRTWRFRAIRMRGCRIRCRRRGSILGPEDMARYLSEFAKAGLINIAGGCCGNTPEHIAAIAKALEGMAAAGIAGKRSFGTRFRGTNRRCSRMKPLRLSGSQPFTQQAGVFIMIGERTNVAGSPKFARLVKEGKFEEAVSVARQQVENGANVLDICMDEGMIDGVAAMTRFLQLLGSEPEVAKVPFMVDSSNWEVIEAGLKCLQGKGIVNSISLKEGEAKFREHAATVLKYGAAAVVMAFDETGQAASFEDKIRVCERAYRILVDEVGFPAEDIIFDPNILTVATGMEEHNNYAVDFINATRWIKANLPHAKVSGGVSNISFSFRGNNRVREAMHSAFLYHAIAAGMDMGIVNAGMLEVYEEIEPKLKELVEDVLLNRRPDATERLVEFGESLKGEGAVCCARRRRKSGATGRWRSG